MLTKWRFQNWKQTVIKWLLYLVDCSPQERSLTAQPTIYSCPLTYKLICFLFWLPGIVVSVWATDGSVGRGVAEWRELRKREAMKGRKLYRNRDLVDRNVCSSMSGLSETSLHFTVTVCFKLLLFTAQVGQQWSPWLSLMLGVEKNKTEVKPELHFIMPSPSDVCEMIKIRQ